MGVIQFAEGFKSRYGSCVPMFYQTSLEEALRDSVQLPAKNVSAFYVLLLLFLWVGVRIHTLAFLSDPYLLNALSCVYVYVRVFVYVFVLYSVLTQAHSAPHFIIFIMFLQLMYALMYLCVCVCFYIILGYLLIVSFHATSSPFI